LPGKIASIFGGSRNDSLIFGTIKWNLSVSYVAICIWYMLFCLNGWLTTLIGFFVMLIFVSGNAFFILKASEENKVNIIEFIALRLGITLFSGWTYYLTFLTFELLLKDMDITSNFFSWILIAMAVLGYLGHSWKGNSPLFGGVFVWVLFNHSEFLLSYN
jgi:hypothetical protein